MMSCFDDDDDDKGAGGIEYMQGLEGWIYAVVTTPVVTGVDDDKLFRM